MSSSLHKGAFQTTRVFAAIILLGILGTILFYLVELVERLVVLWHISHRADATPLPVHGA